MTLAEHPSAYRRLDPEVDFRSVVATGWFPTGHRAAAWLNATISFSAMTAAAAVWAVITPGRWIALSAATVIVVFAVLMMRGHFRVRMVPDTLSRIPLIAVAVATGGSAAMLLAALPILGQPGMQFFVGLLCVLFAAAVVGQAVGVQVVRWNWRRGNLRASAVVFGSDELAREMAIEIDLRREYGVDIVGFVPGTAGVRPTNPSGAVDHNVELALTVRSTRADRLIIGPATSADDRNAVRAARWATSNGLSVFAVPRLYEMGLGMDSMSPDRVRGYPLVRVQRAAHPHVSAAMKRAFDVAVAGTVLALTLPMTLVAAALVKLTSPGPVLFSQERVGRDGRRIVIHKFRSMTVSDSSDTEWVADARITPVGQFLRRSNIDELPQLWSIIRGDMSLVGPRPERPAFVRQFRTEIDGYDDRHRMPVGLTGLAQIAGLRGDTSIAERVKYDNLYIDQWSFGADVQILVKTVVAVLRQARYAAQASELEQAIGGARTNAVAIGSPAVGRAA